MDRVSDAVLEGYRHTSTGTIGHFLSEGFLDWRIQSVYRPVKLVGRAVTVSTPPTDNSLFREALEASQPGDVLVIGRSGDRRHAAWGGIFSLAAQLHGLAGVVIDGAATDWAEINELQFPVFCTNLSALTTRKQGLGGRMAEPISCGGVQVNPGDVVLGDDDGVLVVPVASAAEILERAKAKDAQEVLVRSLLRDGMSLREAAAEAARQLG